MHAHKIYSLQLKHAPKLENFLVAAPQVVHMHHAMSMVVTATVIVTVSYSMIAVRMFKVVSSLFDQT